MSNVKGHEEGTEREIQRPTRRQFLKAGGIATLALSGPTGAFAENHRGPQSSGESNPDSCPGKPNCQALAQKTGPPSSPLFPPDAKWIWDDGNRWAYHRYLQARQRFNLSESELRRIVEGPGAWLTITADAYYQAWLNGRMVGQGPAKSAEGRRSVDTWRVTDLVVLGENVLQVLALSMGTGTMSYCPGDAGLIFALDLSGRTICSNTDTRVRSDPARQKRTVRRWALPCIEHVDATAAGAEWKPATVVDKSVELYPRRVPLPTREVLKPKRIFLAESVRVPNVALSMRLRPYVTEGEQQRRWNHYKTPAYVVTDIVSPINQAFVLTPTLGNVTWYFRGRELFVGSGWDRWKQTAPPVRILLKRGANRFIGVHDRRNHFEDINLAGFADQPVEFRNPFGKGGFQVVRVKDAKDLVRGPAMQSIDWEALKPDMAEMDPADTMPFGNSYDLVYGAEPVARRAAAFEKVMGTYASDPLVIPPTGDGEAFRVMVDLGVLQNGWVAFDAEGHEGSTLILAMFEGIDPGPPLRIQWPDGCNNAVTYRLRNGYQSFESFFPYGVRYIAIHHMGDQAVRVSNLRVLTANCGSVRRGALRADDELLNSIYGICAQSVISGVDDTFTDCPTYEQVNWNCDNRLAGIGEAVTCANDAITRNSLELFAEDPQYPGLVRSQYPSTWDSQIPMWAFHWLMWCRDYYWQAVDKDFVQQIMPRIAAGIDEGLRKIGSRGLLEWPGTWHFVDWAKGRDDDHDIMTAEQAGFVGSLDAAIELAPVAGRDYTSRSQEWSAARRNLVQAINVHLWDAKRQTYFDSLHHDGSPSPVTSQATNAAMVVYGVAPEDRAHDLARRILTGDQQLLPYGSPFGLYYVLEMLDRLGNSEGIFEIVRRRWGAMVMAGDTCTWETFAEFGRHGEWPTRSRCHPFSAYVAKYLAKYLLGVYPLEPGYAKFHVEPKPPKGVTQCHGSVPSPRGLIRVGWEQRDGEIHLSVQHPDDLERV